MEVLMCVRLRDVHVHARHVHVDACQFLDNPMMASKPIFAACRLPKLSGVSQPKLRNYRTGGWIGVWGLLEQVFYRQDTTELLKFVRHLVPLLLAGPPAGPSIASQRVSAADFLKDLWTWVLELISHGKRLVSQSLVCSPARECYIGAGNLGLM
jgi:hypothetical protein